MQIFSKNSNSTLIIYLSGELDEHTSKYTREKIDILISDQTFDKIILDCENLSFMDSTGIGVFLGRYKKMKELNIPLYITGAKDAVDRVFNLSGIYNIMPKIS